MAAKPSFLRDPKGGAKQPKGEGAVVRTGPPAGPHPALRATFSRWEKDFPPLSHRERGRG